MSLWRIQLRHTVSGYTPSGRPILELPLPFIVDIDGNVSRQDHWKGEPYRIIGFVDRPTPMMHVDVWWQEAMDWPEQMTGKFLISADKTSRWWLHTVPVWYMERMEPRALPA